jgi:hypothetical protein
MTVRCKNNLCVLQTARWLAADRLVPGPPDSRSPNNGRRFAALGLLGRVVGDEERSPIEDGRRAGGGGRVIPRNSTTRPPGREERRRVEEQEEEQDHRKDPGFARPITLALTSSSRVGVLCDQPHAHPDVPALPVLVLHVVQELGGVVPVVDVADLRRFDKAVAEVKERQGTARGIVFGVVN